MKNVSFSNRTRYGNRRPRLILCAECRRAFCSCVKFGHRATMVLVRQLLDAGADLAKRREARAGLREILAFDEETARKEANYLEWRRGVPVRTGRRRDLNIADELLGEGRLRQPSVADIAARYRVSVEHVEDLQDRLLRHLAGPVAKPDRGSYPEVSATSTANRKAA